MKPKVLCSSCQAEVRWGEKFCSQCGQQVDWPGEVPASEERVESRNNVCASCGTENSVNASMCKSCGSPLAVNQEARRTKQEKRDKGKQRTTSQPALAPWQIILGLFGAVILILIVTEVQKSRAVPERLQVASSNTPPAANMEALQQIQDLEGRVKANPNDTKLLLDLANHLHDNRFWDKAITSYKKYLDKNPNDGNARVDMGICYKENGDLTSAKREMELVLKRDPDHLNAKFNLGIVALASGDLETSNEWFKKAVAQNAESEVGRRAQQLLSQHNPQSLSN